MQTSDFPPPASPGSPTNTKELRPEDIVALELVDVELSTEPVVAFFQIRISNRDGMVRTVTKRWADLTTFFDKLRHEIGTGSLPWNADEIVVANDELYRNLLQENLDGLLEKPELLERPVCLDFFQLGTEYQERRPAETHKTSRPEVQRQRVERLLGDLYEPLRQRHLRERRELERRGHSATSSRGNEWNRQDVYLHADKLARARAASRRYLMERHPEWLAGPRPLCDEALRDLVQVQHLVDLDLEDLLLPDESKRSRDTFGGQTGNVSEQMILDATRSTFVVNGKLFCFSTLFAEHGEDPDEAQVLKQLFSEAVVEAVEECVGRGGGKPQAMLLRAVSTAMSQAGLAHVECADARGQQVVVSGGDQSVCYELEVRADGAWDVEMSVRKSGFEHFIVCHPKGCDEEDNSAGLHEIGAPQACGPRSFVAKGCRVRFRAPATGPTVEADVLKVHSQIVILDRWGRPLGPTRWREVGCSQGPLRALAEAALRVCAPPFVGRRQGQPQQ